MKKVRFLVCMMLCVSLLGACSAKGEKTTTVCTGVVNGVNQTMTLKANGDELEEQTEEFSIPFADLGVTEEDMDTFMTMLIKEAYGSDEGEGIKGEYEIKDGTVYFAITVDYTKVDYKKLEEAGVLEKGLITTQYISLQRSIKSFEDQGLICK